MADPDTANAMLEAAEYCANMLEGNQLVPMWEPPTARIRQLRGMPPSGQRNWEIRTFLYELAETLRKNSMML